MARNISLKNSQMAILEATWSVVIHPLAEPELAQLPPDLRARFLHIAELLESFGPQQVGLSHVRPLQQKLRAMRRSGRYGIHGLPRFARNDRAVRRGDAHHPCRASQRSRAAATLRSLTWP